MLHVLTDRRAGVWQQSAASQLENRHRYIVLEWRLLSAPVGSRNHC